MNFLCLGLAVRRNCNIFAVDESRVPWLQDVLRKNKEVNFYHNAHRHLLMHFSIMSKIKIRRLKSVLRNILQALMAQASKLEYLEISRGRCIASDVILSLVGGSTLLFACSCSDSHMNRLSHALI